MTKATPEEITKEVGMFFESIHKITTILMAAALAWLVGTVNESSKDLAVVKVKVESALADRYTAKDAVRDKFYYDSKIDQLSSRLDRIEKRYETK